MPFNSLQPILPAKDFDGAWYALYTRPRHEKAVARSLAAKRLSVFLPLYSALRRWKDRTKVVMLPLFSCYVFIQGCRDRHLQVVSTPGVHGFVCCAGLPARIPEKEIEAIRQVVERSIKIEPHPFIRRGDMVRVKAGPLEGIQGILVRKKNFTRIVLTVELLGKSAAVEVDVSLIERISAHRNFHPPVLNTDERFDFVPARRMTHVPHAVPSIK